MRVRIQTLGAHLDRDTGPQQIHYLSPASGFGRPAPISLLSSLCFHGLAISGVLSLHFAPPPPRPIEISRPEPTTLKIGDKIFFVSELPPPRPTPRVPSPLKVEPPDPPKPVAKATAQVAPPAPKPAPRLFVPPEVKRNPLSETTLLQPASALDLVPPDVPLPNLRVLTGQPTRKITRAFVAPGQRKPPPPDPVRAPPPPPPDLVNLAHAAPVAMNRPSTLILPPTPVLDTTMPKIDMTTAPPPLPVGDPVDLLALSSRPVPLTDKIVVPAGNVVGRSGDAPALAAGTGAGPGNGSSTPAPPNPRPAAPASSGSGSQRASVSGPGAAGAFPIPSTPVAPNGSASGTAGPSAAPPAPAIAGNIIRRPSNGTFDAVVVQSNAADQTPEVRQLLTGRPIYTVYVSVGTAKDWALNFCIPGERETSSAVGGVVTLGQKQPAPVQAPYPFVLVKPDVSVPSYYKTVLVYGRVNAAGRFENLKVVRSIKPETDQALIVSLSKWEFRPASRDGVNVGVEFLLAIPVAGL